MAERKHLKTNAEYEEYGIAKEVGVPLQKGVVWWGIEVSYTENGVKKTVKTAYQHPTLETFQEWVASLLGDALELSFDNHIYGVDLKARAKVRPASLIESTMVLRGGVKFDLMALPGDTTFAKAVAAVNNAFDSAMPYVPDEAAPAVREAFITKLVPAPFRVARRKLLETKKVREREVEVEGKKVLKLQVVR